MYRRNLWSISIIFFSQLKNHSKSFENSQGILKKKKCFNKVFKLSSLHFINRYQNVLECSWRLLEVSKSFWDQKKNYIPKFWSISIYFSHNSKITQNPLRIVKGIWRKKSLKKGFQIIYSTFHKGIPKYFWLSFEAFRTFKTIFGTLVHFTLFVKWVKIVTHK